MEICDIALKTKTKLNSNGDIEKKEIVNGEIKTISITANGEKKIKIDKEGLEKFDDSFKLEINFNIKRNENKIKKNLNGKKILNDHNSNRGKKTFEKISTSVNIALGKFKKNLKNNQLNYGKKQKIGFLLFIQ